MSKRTRYADNSKRQQPVQQQRAQAAAQQLLAAKQKARPAERGSESQAGAEGDSPRKG